MTVPIGQKFKAKICQDGGKALMTDPNKTLSQWLLRTVLNLKEGEVATYDKLNILGFDSVNIIKQDFNSYKIEIAPDESLRFKWTRKIRWHVERKRVEKIKNQNPHPAKVFALFPFCFWDVDVYWLHWKWNKDLIIPRMSWAYPIPCEEGSLTPSNPSKTALEEGFYQRRPSLPAFGVFDKRVHLK